MYYRLRVNAKHALEIHNFLHIYSQPPPPNAYQNTILETKSTCKTDSERFL